MKGPNWPDPETLSVRLSRGPLSPAEALETALQIGACLQQKHARNEVHGSVTPDSVLLREEGIVLAGPAPCPTGVRYLAPEQVQGLDPDSRVDIWAFGAILYEMLSGEPPFDGDSEERLRQAILEQDPRPLETLLAGLPAASVAALDAVVAGCLTKARERRRQRIQNALIELKLIAKPLLRRPAGRTVSKPAVEPASRLFAGGTAGPDDRRRGQESPRPSSARPELPVVADAAPGSADLPVGFDSTPDPASPIAADASEPAAADLLVKIDPTPTAEPICLVANASEPESPAVADSAPAAADFPVQPDCAPNSFAAGPIASPEPELPVHPDFVPPSGPMHLAPVAVETESPVAADPTSALSDLRDVSEAAPAAPQPLPVTEFAVANVARTADRAPDSEEEVVAPTRSDEQPTEAPELAAPAAAAALSTPFLVPLESKPEAAANPDLGALPPPAQPIQNTPAIEVPPPPRPRQAAAGVTGPTAWPDVSAPGIERAASGSARSGPASAEFQVHEPTPAGDPGSNVLTFHRPRREPRLARLLPRMAPLVDAEYVRAVEAAPDPEPEPDPQSRVRPIRPIEPAPRSTADALPDAVPGQLTYSAGRHTRFWIFGGVLLLVAACAVAATWHLARRQKPRVLRVAPPPVENGRYPGSPAISPDGRRLVFSALGPEGTQLLWLRTIDTPHSTPIPGTENGLAPFWSPDSRHIGFFAARTLKRVPAEGGAVLSICDVEAQPGGGSWSADGTILFAPGLSGGILRVTASGGTPEPVTELSGERRDRAHLWPRFLPDGKRFLFYALTEFENTSGIYQGSLDRSPARQLLSSETNAVYAASADGSEGRLLYVRAGRLFAQPFDRDSLVLGESTVGVADEVGAVRSIALAPVSASENGVLVYQSLGKPRRQLAWFDRSGRQVGSAGEPGEYGPPRISPDGRDVLVERRRPGSSAANLWLLRGDGSTVRVADTTSDERSPAWSPDGSGFVYASISGGACEIYTRRLAGGTPQLLVKSSEAKYPTDWTADSRLLLFGGAGGDSRPDVWLFGLRDRSALPLIQTAHAESQGTASRDGRWLAYQSDEGGRPEVYIQPFRPSAGSPEGRQKVSTGGGAFPRWRADGKELFYITPDGAVMSVAVSPDGDAVRAESPRLLFRTIPIPQIWNSFDVAPDGQRFLVNVPLEWSTGSPITIVANWTEKLGG